MRARRIALLALTAAPLVVVGLAPTATSAAPVPHVVGSITLPTFDEAERQLTDLLNLERKARGLQTLTRVSTLDVYARNWSGFMAKGGCVARDGRRLCHRTDLKTVADAAAPNGWVRAGENVGLVPDGGTIKSLHDAFVASAAHLANIAQKDFNAIGVGVAFDTNGTLFVTYEFLATMGRPSDGTTSPESALPPLPPGLSFEDQLLFYINDARAKAGLGALRRTAVLDREATTWSQALASRTCGGNTALCHRKDLSSVARAAAGSGNVRWWGENVGLRQPASIANQFIGFMNSAGHRANIMRPDVNLAGIGYVIDAYGKAYTTLEFVTAKKLTAITPPSGTSCGWIQVTLRPGTNGVYARVAQCALAAKGLYRGPIDGVYDADVIAAVKALQTQIGVKRPNGVLDLKTRKALGVA